jgi:hypothetical protein
MKSLILYDDLTFAGFDEKPNNVAYKTKFLENRSVDKFDFLPLCLNLQLKRIFIRLIMYVKSSIYNNLVLSGIFCLDCLDNPIIMSEREKTLRAKFTTNNPSAQAELNYLFDYNSHNLRDGIFFRFPKAVCIYHDNIKKYCLWRKTDINKLKT